MFSINVQNEMHLSINRKKESAFKPRYKELIKKKIGTRPYQLYLLNNNMSTTAISRSDCGAITLLVKGVFDF
jgi:hypothetical protein